MVRRDVWLEAVPWNTDGGMFDFLCIGCLEVRLGRLTAEDFPDQGRGATGGGESASQAAVGRTTDTQARNEPAPRTSLARPPFTQPGSVACLGDAKFGHQRRPGRCGAQLATGRLAGRQEC